MTIGKDTLLRAIAGQNRGLVSTEVDRRAILAAIARVEDYNPTPNPLEAKDLLEGDWRLLYTTSNGILGIEKPPFVRLGQVYQCVRPKDARIYNIAEVQSLPYLDGIVSVTARFEAVSNRRVEVKFDRSIIASQRLIDYSTPARLIAEIEAGKNYPPLDFAIPEGQQQGWLDTTYLDSDLRIGRGNRGSVFVLTK